MLRWMKLSVQLAFPHTADICSDQFNLLSIITPRYLAESTLVRVVFWIVYSAWEGANLLVILKTWHFSGWNSILLVIAQAWRVFRSFWRMAWSSGVLIIR